MNFNNFYAVRMKTRKKSKEDFQPSAYIKQFQCHRFSYSQPLASCLCSLCSYDITFIPFSFNCNDSFVCLCMCLCLLVIEILERMESKSMKREKRSFADKEVSFSLDLHAYSHHRQIESLSEPTKKNIFQIFMLLAFSRLRFFKSSTSTAKFLCCLLKVTIQKKFLKRVIII